MPSQGQNPSGRREEDPRQRSSRPQGSSRTQGGYTGPPPDPYGVPSITRGIESATLYTHAPSGSRERGYDPPAAQPHWPPQATGHTFGQARPSMPLYRSGTGWDSGNPNVREPTQTALSRPQYREQEPAPLQERPTIDLMDQTFPAREPWISEASYDREYKRWYRGRRDLFGRQEQELEEIAAENRRLDLRDAARQERSSTQLARAHNSRSSTQAEPTARTAGISSSRSAPYPTETRGRTNYPPAQADPTAPSYHASSVYGAQPPIARLPIPIPLDTMKYMIEKPAAGSGGFLAPPSAFTAPAETEQRGRSHHARSQSRSAHQRSRSTRELSRPLEQARPQSQYRVQSTEESRTPSTPKSLPALLPKEVARKMSGETLFRETSRIGEEALAFFENPVGRAKGKYDELDPYRKAVENARVKRDRQRRKESKDAGSGDGTDSDSDEHVHRESYKEPKKRRTIERKPRPVLSSSEGSSVERTTLQKAQREYDKLKLKLDKAKIRDLGSADVTIPHSARPELAQMQREASTSLNRLRMVEQHQQNREKINLGRRGNWANRTAEEQEADYEANKRWRTENPERVKQNKEREKAKKEATRSGTARTETAPPPRIGRDAWPRDPERRSGSPRSSSRRVENDGRRPRERSRHERRQH